MLKIKVVIPIIDLEFYFGILQTPYSVYFYISLHLFQ